MDESESKKENRNGQKRRFDPVLLKKGFRCDLDQYDMLKRCSEKKDMTEWNEWREENPNEVIWLQGAKFCECHLKGAKLWGAHLESANLEMAHLEGANLERAHLIGAFPIGAHLEGAYLYVANLQRANLLEAHLENAKLQQTKMQSADFSRAIVDGSTLIWKPEVNKYRRGKRSTNFNGVGLDSCRIDPGTKQLLEYNIRRKNWEVWYKEHLLLKWPVRWFWCLSDYGISTWRVIIWFLVLSLLFATIYANCAYWRPLGIVSNLEVEPHLPMWHYFLLLLLRPIYFSIVTMTTLGFGDMYANAQSIWGHILLSLQVILGYVLLGALVTRFAVLFTAGGPAGRFADEKKNKPQIDTD